MQTIDRILFISLLALSACVKDKPETQIKPPVNAASTEKVFVINEGNFGSGNASVSYYNPKNGDMIEDFYSSQNSQALGDVAQSICRIGNSYYLVVNNSGKIVVCDLNFKKSALISGLSSPRYMLKVSDQKAYVSDYKANALHIIDLTGNVKTGSIPCKGWTEEMILAQGKVFVCNVLRNYVYVIDAAKDALIDSIMVGTNASDIQVDKEGKIWVLSSGSNTFGPGRLNRINPVNHVIEKVLVFSPGHSPFKLCINGNRDSVYYCDQEVYRMSVYDSGLPLNAYILSKGKNIYGLGIDPHTSECYLSDALDYVQRSHIMVYLPNGQIKTEFRAGINANGFYFE